MRERRSRQATINGGLSDSEATALAVAPAGPPGPAAETIVTAVGSAAIAARMISGATGLDLCLGASRGAESMMPPVLRTLWLSTAAIAAVLALGACGTEGIQLSEGDSGYQGAVLFAERCSGCHTLEAAGAQGSANRELRNQGPNLDQRTETAEDVLYAIRNGGFSGALMPQNILVGEEADAVAEFVAEYAGTDVDRPVQPGDATEAESEAEQAAAAGE